MTYNEYERKYGDDITSCIREEFPSVYETLHDYEFNNGQLFFILNNLLEDGARMRYYRTRNEVILEWTDCGNIIVRKPTKEENALSDADFERIFNGANPKVFKYLKLDVVPYSAVVSKCDLRAHFDAVMDEFGMTNLCYIYVPILGKHRFVHYTNPENVESIRREGLKVGSDYCDVGEAVYAYSEYMEEVEMSHRAGQIPIVFEADNMYICVASGDTMAPIRYCASLTSIPPEQILPEGTELNTLPVPEFMDFMGFPPIYCANATDLEERIILIYGY